MKVGIPIGVVDGTLGVNEVVDEDVNVAVLKLLIEWMMVLIKINDETRIIFMTVIMFLTLDFDGYNVLNRIEIFF